MGRFYYFMRKNEPITMIQLDEYGKITHYANNYSHQELLPLYNLKDHNGLAKWWERRSVPLSQHGIQAILNMHGYSDTPEYLTANLGLSLTDYYWIKPVDSDLTWKKVNLFANDFKADKMIQDIPLDDNDTIPHYSPNSSLQGNIEKTWTIMNGERYLLKGNRGMTSTQSLNEVFASEIYRLQNYDNFTEYNLIKIKGKDYDFGCYSRNFASEDVEFIPAYDIVCSRKCPNHKSTFEHFIEICVDYGMDRDQLRADLEMQILVDYIISGHDRHLNNLGVLRDAESLEFVRLAPIFDSGDAFFTGRAYPATNKEWLSINVNGFCSLERDMLSKVTDFNRVDLSKLPSNSFLKELYGKDTKASAYVTEQIIACYEKKIDMLSDLQHGNDPYKIMY